MTYYFRAISCLEVRELHSLCIHGGSTHGLVASELDYNSIVSELKLQLCYHVHFWTNTLEKGMDPLSLQQ